MINPEELMIGNYVNDENGFQMEVCSIHDDGTVYCDFDGNEGDMWEFDEKNPPKGIEITNEELSRLGFENDGLLYEFRSAEYVLKSDFKYVWVYDVELKSCICVKCEHVHELQNLFYILTGKQLRYE